MTIMPSTRVTPSPTTPRNLPTIAMHTTSNSSGRISSTYRPGNSSPWPRSETHSAGIATTPMHPLRPPTAAIFAIRGVLVAAPLPPLTVSLATDGTVTWTAPYDGGRAITNYVVQWKDYGQGYHSSRQAEVSATSTLTYATGKTSGGSSVRVAAMSLFGQGRFSEASQPAVAPGKPTVSAVIAGDGELAVKWRAPASSGGADITSYDVRSILSSALDKADRILGRR